MVYICTPLNTMLKTSLAATTKTRSAPTFQRRTKTYIFSYRQHAHTHPSPPPRFRTTGRQLFQDYKELSNPDGGAHSSSSSSSSGINPGSPRPTTMNTIVGTPQKPPRNPNLSTPMRCGGGGGGHYQSPVPQVCIVELWFHICIFCLFRF